jgi:Uma2 family endonuclease
MAIAPIENQIDDGPYAGLRLGVDEYLELPEDGNRYQMINGVILMSPRAVPIHQVVAAEVVFQLQCFLRAHQIGKVFPEIDVVLDSSPRGGLIYSPDAIFVRNERLPRKNKAMVGPPDLVMEVISPGSRRMDTKTKRDDYERCGVLEYWLIDSDRQEYTFFRLRDGKYIEETPEQDIFKSEAVPGFVLDLAALREVMKGW